MATVSQEAENVALVQSLYAAFGRGDMETLIAALADDIEWISPGPSDAIAFAGHRRGVPEVMQFFAALNGALEFEKFEPQEFIAQGDKVVVIGVSRVRGRGTGRSTDNDWVAVITLRNGKVIRYRLYEDTIALAAALR